MVSEEYQAISGRKVDIPLELNQEVLINLNYFLNDARGFMIRSLNRGQKYIPIMKAILKQKGLPEDLVYLALIESGYRTEAVSHASAVGPWQFIASTGRRYGLTIDEWVDERMDPIMSTYAAADYLIALYEMFNSWPLAIAAYNSGEGKIIKGMQKPEVDNYWDMAKADGFLANETKRYVPSFLAAAIIAKDPLAYGLEVVEAEVDSWDEVVVPEPIELTMAAQLSGTNLERIKELNPHLKRMATPPSERDFVLRVPRGGAESFYQLYAQLPEAQRSNRMVIHQAKRGETVETVAREHDLTPEVVRQYNNLTSSRLTAGQRLVLPATMAQAPGVQEPIQVAAQTVRGGPSSSFQARLGEAQSMTARAVFGAEELRPPSSVNRQASARPAKAPSRAVLWTSGKERPPVIASIRHRVRAGETLGELAKRYGTTSEKLRESNRLSSNSIREGQVLVVGSNLTVAAAERPRRPANTWVEETEETPVYHLVKAGESLGSIAAQRGTTAERLRSLNSLESSRIMAGQRLLVGSAPAEAAPAAGGGSGVYVVRPGDTVGQIAQRHNLTVAKLRELNRLEGDRINPGQELKVAEAARPAALSARVYEVRPGDTVSQIAERHNMTSAELRSLNKLNGDRIVQGQKLRVLAAVAPGDPPAVTPAVARSTAGGEVYEVKPGDSLSVVAERHNLTSAELRALNGLTSDRIRAGQKLKVSAPTAPPAAVGQAARSAKPAGQSPDPLFYEVAAGDTVSQIAERHNLTVAELRALNDLADDRIRSGQRLKVAAEAQPKVSSPTGTRGQASQAPAAYYEAVPGDTVSVIAERHNLTSAELRALNDLADDRIRVGQRLLVSAAGSPPAAAARSASQASAQASTKPQAQPAARSAAPAAASGLYEVVPGDTVSQVAERHDMASAELRALNDLTDDRIRPGQKLKVKGPAAASPAANPARPASQASAPAAASGLYEVAPGDTVSQIAERHDMTSADLRALNDLADDRIRPGQKLKVKGPAPASPAERRTSSEARPASPRPTGATAASGNPEDYYVAEAGDSVTSVAAFFNLAPAELRRLNGVAGDQLSPGQRILVKKPAASQPMASASAGSSVSPGTYKVEGGDTFFSVARAHNLTVDELKKLNGKSDDSLRPGQILKVK
jgi:membrane-bound lytic murein transglycosylase D